MEQFVCGEMSDADSGDVTECTNEIIFHALIPVLVIVLSRLRLLRRLSNDFDAVQPRSHVGNDEPIEEVTPLLSDVVMRVPSQSLEHLYDKLSWNSVIAAMLTALQAANQILVAAKFLEISDKKSVIDVRIVKRYAFFSALAAAICWLSTLAAQVRCISSHPWTPRRSYWRCSMLLFATVYLLCSGFRTWSAYEHGGGVQFPWSSGFWDSSVSVTSLDLMLPGMMLLCEFIRKPSNSLPDWDIPGNRRPSLETSAGYLSKLFFFWLDPMIALGHQKPLEDKDLWELAPEDDARFAHRQFTALAPKYPNSLQGLVMKCFLATWPFLVKQYLFALASTLLYFSGPFFISRILWYMQEPDTKPLRYSGLDVLGLFFGAVGSSLCGARSYFLGRRLGMRIRAMLIGECYAKTLRRRVHTGVRRHLSSMDMDGDDSGPRSASTGEILNIMQSDTHRLTETSCYLHYLVANPLEFAICTGALWRVLGWSSIVGIAIMSFGIVPLNGIIARKQQQHQKLLMTKTDKRIELVNETLQGIRLIKYFAWEKAFAERINASRAAELSALRKYFMFYTTAKVFWFTTPLVVSFLSFALYTTVGGGTLDASTAFVSLALFAALKHPINILPDVIAKMLEGAVSFRRIAKFLAEDEQSVACVMGTRIGFEHASFDWEAANPGDDRRQATEDGICQPPSHFILQDLSIEFPIGKLSVVAGKTGSGKSSLLSAMIGEMRCLFGKTFLPARPLRLADSGGACRTGIAYVPQQVWLQHDTIRRNILFGSPYDAARYRRVIEACCLKQDFAAMEFEDLTEIGEKGLQLSGGQRQRVNLARAVYSDAHLLLLDDVLSSVDAPTQSWIFKNCITSDLMKGRTVVMVTHAVSLCIPKCDFLVLLDNGRIVTSGSVDEVLGNAHAIPLMSALRQLEISERKLRKSGGEVREARRCSARLTDLGGSTATLIGSSDCDGASDGKNETAEIYDTALKRPCISDSADGVGTPRDPADGKRIAEEARQTGRVKIQVYSTFFTAAGRLGFWSMLLLLFTLTQLATLANDLWLRYWSLGADRNTSEPYVVVYGLLNIASMGFLGLRYIIQYTGSLRISAKVHETMLHAMLRAPLLFFDRTPLGRILNRFSKDIHSIDQELVGFGGDFARQLFMMLTTIVVICTVTPLFIIAIVPLVYVTFWIGDCYLLSSRELKRLDATAKSPIYSKFEDTVSGKPIIRAFGAEERFMNDMYQRINHWHRPFFWMWAANRWLQIRLDFVGALISAGTAIAVVTNLERLDAGFAGLTLVMTINLADCLVWVVRWHAQLEMALNSLERCQEYLSIASESPEVIDECRPPSNWPQEGKIEFQNIVLQYSPEDPPVLDKISFVIPPRTRVAIVGRTGAGKTTLAISLFRIVEATAGRILIDGLDIGRIGLADLRSRLNIIPQDPVLFVGTIRSNLDPFGQYTDLECWTALRRVHFINSSGDLAYANSRYTLDSPVSEGGANFSLGQRQLLALARSCLRASRIVIMDEATASVDSDTDAQIQKTIRTEFRGVTLLCIAHRLKTVCDFPLVIVMDHGQVVQYGSPLELMNLKSGIFFNMCQRSGEFEFLRRMAEIASARSSENTFGDYES